MTAPALRRSGLSGLIIAVLVALTALLGAGPAAAHAQLMRTDPADGAELATGPEQVTMTFNEDISPEFATMNVVGPDGRLWQSGDVVVDGREVSIPVGELGPIGEYTVAARVISADGHAITPLSRFILTEEGTGTPGELADASVLDQADEGGIAAWVWWMIGVAGVIVILILVWLLVRNDPGDDDKS